MSSAGQIAGGIVGAVAGFFIGGPTGALYGAQIGLMAGGYLDPPKGPSLEGPRLDDLSVQTSTYGAVIPRVYGTVALNGNVIWLENNALKETVTNKKSGGKGGGSTTTTRTYSYSATFAVGLCKGPIAGVRRIWIGADLIYDAGSSDPNTITASNNAATGFQLYTGTDTQLPDARIQATMGVANTPAWRGLAYIVFYDLQLARYSNSLAGAQVRVEILQLGTVSTYVATRYDMPTASDHVFTAWNGSVFVRLAHFNNNVWVSPDAITWTQYAAGFGASCFWMGLVWGNGLFVAPSYQSGMPVWTSPDGVTWTSNANPAGNGPIAFGNNTFVIGCANGSQCATSTTGTSWTAVTLPFSSSGNGSMVLHNGSTFLIWMNAINRVMVSTTGGAGTWTGGAPNGVSLNNHSFGVVKAGVFFLGSASGIAAKSSPDGVIWTDLAVIPANKSMGADNNNFLCFGNDRFYTSPTGAAGTWTLYQTLGNDNYPYVGDCWNGAFHSVCCSNSAYAYRIVPTYVSPIFPSLDTIVSAECLQSGLLSAGDIDMTALAASTVRGYIVGSLGSIRAALEPLQGAWPFDVRQHGYKIQFVARGGASVVTIPAADLDARGAGQQPGVQITTSREMDSQMPRRVTVKHLDYDREYNVGSQYAERLNTAAINARALDLPIVLTATEAAGKAEVLLYLYWLERYDVAINLPPTYLQLEPGDVVTLVTPEGNVSLRLTTVDYTSDGRVECKAKYDKATVYTPTAVASAPTISGATTINPVGASVYALLDIPLVSSAQSGPSFLAAMTGALAGWHGGVLMQSNDEGSTWASLHDFGAPGSSMGTCTNSIGSVEPRQIDNASALTVTLTQGALYSITQLAMLAGGNHFAYGQHGRWEIIAAQTCTLVSGTTYTLTNLLRGRFGTEWAMGLHTVGDSLVLLDTTDVAAITMSSGAIGLSYLYRGITVGRDISTDSNRTFAYQGVNLKPLSPIALTGAIDPGTNDWSLSWIRRTRTGGEWRDYVDADLGESSEAYQIEIYSDGTYTTVKRTISTTTPAASYTSAQQVADFGANQATLYLKIYQISASVGRGYPLTQSITR